MIDHDLQVLIEKAARDELGEEALADLTARAEHDPALARALSDAREEYRTMSGMPQPCFSPEDLPAIRDAIKARAVTERRQAVFLGSFIPGMCVVFVIHGVLRMDDPTTADVGRGVWLLLGLGGGTSLAVWCWWRWYRMRATKAASGDPRDVEAWVRSRGRGAKREMIIGTIGGLIILVIMLYIFIHAIVDGDWSTVAFWVVFMLIMSIANTVMMRIEARNGS